MEQQIIITIKTPITPEAHEKLEDKLKGLLEVEGLEATIENTATGNSVSVVTDKSAMFKCELCGLEVEQIPRWRKSECPVDEYQHHFIEV